MAQFLTENGLQSLISGQGNGFILQLIKKKNINGQYFKGILSDGYAAQKVKIARDAAAAIQDIPDEISPVLNIVDPVITTDKGISIVVHTLTVVNSKVAEVIGKPIEYDEYQKNDFTNADGSRQIPKNYLSAQEVQQGNQQQQLQKQQQVQQMQQFQKQNPMQQQQQQQQQQQKPPVLQQQLQKPQFQQQQQQQQVPKPMGNPLARSQNVQKNPNFMNKPNNNAMNHQRMGQNTLQKSKPVQQMQQQAQNFEYTPLQLLNPHSGNNWKLKCKVTRKKDIRQGTSKAGKEYKLFSIDLLDSDGGEITASFFGNAVDKFFNEIEEGGTYEFQNGDVKDNNSKQFNRPHQYVLNFSERSIIGPCQDDGNIQVKYQFVPIQEAVQYDANSQIDVIAVIHEVKETTQINAKSGPMNKRDVVIVDKGGVGQQLTFWREQCDNENIQKGSIILIKSARINEYQGSKSISIGFTSTVDFNNQNVPEVQDLVDWYNQSQNIQIKVNQSSGSLTKRIYTLYEVEENTKDLTAQDKPKWHDVLACFTYVKHDGTLFYISCPECKKKVEPEDDELNGICNKCNKQVQGVARYVVGSLKIADCSSSIFCKIFDEPGQILFGRTANEIREVQQTNADKLKDVITENQCREFRMTILSKPDFYDGNTRIVHEIKRITLDHDVNTTQLLLNQIQEYIKQ